MTSIKKTTTLALATAACVTFAAAAPFALADQPAGNPKGPKTTTSTTTTAPATTTTPTTPTTPATPAEKKKGYGVLCKGQSKKHVKGQKGTPFSQCVVALAKIDSGKTTSPKVACKALSKKHVTGTKGTPFSLCVKAAAQQAEKTAAAS
jgi:hypothetical protein